MDLEEYRIQGKIAVDFITDYLANIRERRVLPDVKPGYLNPLLPDSAPEEGEGFDAIMADVVKVIMPGITHWQSPQFYAYVPFLNSPASILGDMLSSGIGCLSFSWAASPACTELEMKVMDWLGKLVGLPDCFLHSASNGKGGGAIQSAASESTLVALLAARAQMFQNFHEKSDQVEEDEINKRLVAYTSDQAHSSVEKAGLIAFVKMRLVESDSDFSMRGPALSDAIRKDKEKGLIPFFVCASLGTTSACSFDNLREIGEICNQENLWLHVDAAYAGCAFVCPEFRKWLDGIEYVDSIALNPSKWLMVHYGCSAMWVKNSERIQRTFNIDPLYLRHENSGRAVDFVNWHVSLSKPFRALKLWFVLRNFGVKGLQKHIRHGVDLAKELEGLVQKDERFEIPGKRHLGIVLFRVKGENELSQNLLKKINSSGKLHCVPSCLKGKFVIRFAVCSPVTLSTDIQEAWANIQNMCSEILNDCQPPHP